jgi:hypothetical protein
MTNYPGEPPQPSDGPPPQGQTPQDGPTGGSAEGQSDVELTQPVGYWERQAAEQARAQREAQQWGQRPDPTTAYPQQSSGQLYGPPYGRPPQAQQPYQQPYAGPYDQPYGQPYAQAAGYPPAAGQSGPAYGAPQGYPPYGAFAPPRTDHPQSTLSLVLGLVGLVGALMLCGLPLVVSPFAWALGRNALKDIEASQGQVGGEGQARAGMIMGIIGTILAVIAVLGILILVVVSIASSDSTSGSSI